MSVCGQPDGQLTQKGARIQGLRRLKLVNSQWRDRSVGTAFASKAKMSKARCTWVLNLAISILLENLVLSFWSFLIIYLNINIIRYFNEQSLRYIFEARKNKGGNENTWVINPSNTFLYFSVSSVTWPSLFLPSSSRP